MSTTAVNRTIKILIADQEPLVREALKGLVADLGRPTEVFEVDTVEAAREASAANPDLALVILDVVLPDATGIEAVHRMQPANVPILVLSGKDDPATARAVLEAGARGFISKRSTTRVLAEAVRLVLVGGMYVPPEALRAVAGNGSVSTADEDGPSPLGQRSFDDLGLTPRQRDVLTLLMQGKPNKSICRELTLAEGTVKTHTAAIYRALGVTNRTQAVYAMSRLGVGLPPAQRTPGPEVVAAPRERAPVRETTRARAAAESLRTVTNRIQAAAEGGGRWAALLGFQPV